MYIGLHLLWDWLGRACATKVQENERVEVPPTHSPLSEEQFQDLSALYPLQRTLHSSVHAVDVFQEVLDYVTDIIQ